jgi:thiol peroxidase
MKPGRAPGRNWNAKKKESAVTAGMGKESLVPPGALGYEEGLHPRKDPHMATIHLKGKPIQTSGNLPAVGSVAPDVALAAADLSDKKISSFAGKRVLNIFPSLDTGVCAMSVRTFNKKAAGKPGVSVLNISMDLPFAMKRFCAAEGIEGAVTLSAFRSDFAEKYGLEIREGGMAGLCSRAVIVLDEAGKVLYTEQVPEITQEPSYDAALAKI